MAVSIQPTEKQRHSEFAKLLEKHGGQSLLEEGSIVRGRIIQMTNDYVVMDIGFKSEGLVSIQEFKTPRGELTHKVGDEVEVLIENIEDDQGIIRLSKERADAFKAWDSLVQIQQAGGIVEGIVTAKIKGGLQVDVGVKAFLPGSQIDVRPVRNLDKFVGKKFRFKILKLNKRRGNIVLSRKEVLEKEHQTGKEETLQHLKEKEVLEGVVKNVTDYGVFVDLGGVDGLLHVTDMSWGRVSHPSDLFKVGDPIRVVVLKIDEVSKKVSLGLKQLQEDPWQEVEGKFPVGSKIKGKVVSLTDYGAFVELCPGIEGLVHVSELSWDKRIKSASQAVSVGTEVEAIVLDVDVASRRIALGMKQLQQNPWEIIESKCSVGGKVKGTIRNITDFGLFVDCGIGVDGLVHISDLTWIQNFTHPEELFKKGDPIEVVVLNIDKEHERFSLGLKQLSPNPWEKIHANSPVGTEVEGEVIRINNLGAVCRLSLEGMEGLLPKSKCPKDLKTGDTLKLEVAEVNEESRKFYLTAAN